jgi:hypothetical protein
MFQTKPGKLTGTLPVTLKKKTPKTCSHSSFGAYRIEKKLYRLPVALYRIPDNG